MKKLMLIAVVALLAPCSQGQQWLNTSQNEGYLGGGSYGMDTRNIGTPSQTTECISPLGQMWRTFTGWFKCRIL